MSVRERLKSFQIQDKELLTWIPKELGLNFEIMIQNSSHKGVGVSTWHTFNNGEPILLCYDFMGLFHTYIILKRGKFER